MVLPVQCKALQAMLAKLPKPAKTGSEEQQLLAKQSVDAFSEVVIGRWETPEVRERTARFVAEQRALIAQATENPGAEKFASVGALQHLPFLWDRVHQQKSSCSYS